MLNERDRLQSKYKINPEGYVLIPLQIENDTQILHHSPYNNMDEFVEEVKEMQKTWKTITGIPPKKQAKLWNDHCNPFAKQPETGC